MTMLFTTVFNSIKNKAIGDAVVWAGIFWCLVLITHPTASSYANYIKKMSLLLA